MIAKETYLKGCFIIEPSVYKDERGYFSETYNSKDFRESLGFDIKFVQDNESMSSKGVLRGLHYQIGEYAQAKLVRVIRGSVLDVVVDLRKDSKTFGKHFSMELSEENKIQLYVPRGFAHGFLVLENETVFSYKCDNFYNKDAEAGIAYNDKNLAIDWGLDNRKITLSEKDKNLPLLKNALL